jgi:hypothetical protein
LNNHTATVQNAAGQTDTLGIAFYTFKGNGRVVIDMGGSTIDVTGSFGGLQRGQIHSMGPIASLAGVLQQIVYVQNVRLVTRGWGYSLINNSVGLIMIGPGVDFGPSVGPQIAVAAPGGRISVACTGYTVSGSAPTNILATFNGAVDACAAPTVIRFVNNPTFSTGFVQAWLGGTVFIPNWTYTGTMSGPKAWVDGNATLYTGTSCGAGLPGSAAHVGAMAYCN